MVVAITAAAVAWVRLREPDPHILPDEMASLERELAGFPELAHYLRSQRIDLNRANAAELAVVPGLGAGLAQRIVADRGVRGPFQSVAALERVRGVGPATLKRLARWLEIREPSSATAAQSSNK